MSTSKDPIRQVAETAVAAAQRQRQSHDELISNMLAQTASPRVVSVQHVEREEAPPQVVRVRMVESEQKPASEVVAIYVRRGDNDRERTIAFRIPSALNRMELLNEGFAIDGRQAIFTIAWVHTGWDPSDREQATGYYDAPFGQSGETLSKALNIAQLRLVEYLREHGFEADFA